MSVERLSNDTKVDIERLSDSELTTLIEEREAKRDAIQHDIDRFFEEITRRHQGYSAECGESQG